MHDLNDSLREWRRLALMTVLTGVVTVTALGTVWLALPGALRLDHTSPAAYDVQFSLEYTGQPAPGGVYGSIPATTGQPLYLTSLSSLNIVLRYHFSSPSASSVAGTVTAAVVVEDQGLNEFIVGPTKVPLSNGSAVVNLPISLSRYSQVISRLSTVASSSSYPVDVVAASAVSGSVSEQRIKSSAKASFAFTGASTILIPVAATLPAGASSPSTPIPSLLSGSGASRAGPPMLSDSRGAVSRSVPAAGDVKIGGFRFPSLPLAVVGAVVALAAGTTGIRLGRRLRRKWDQDPRLAVAQRLASRAVATKGPVPDGENVIYVERAEDLRRMSRVLEVPILRVEAEEGSAAFMVHDDRYVYCYRVGVVVDAEDVESSGLKPSAPWISPADSKRLASEGASRNGSVVEAP